MFEVRTHTQLCVRMVKTMRMHTWWCVQIL